MRLNVNGFLSPGFRLGRGLRQRDPISPLLFNLVLEHFIRSILSDGRIHGSDGPSPSLRALSAPVQGPSTLPPLKVLAYVDDLCVFFVIRTIYEPFRSLYDCTILRRTQK
ncbi:uncharacterized protein RHIMIDRAFT_264429 [Rhizopus microsporus ATCC 52813]|uniref:Reverse transcriptase domain-containing protein n=1 Tax=Rhizopus microsporus ATCC 52813 TaxID=1340429 RepID=A0A2G4T4E7_RHIZD|nr:uncharacterized protein RHIMIDRAFT_264429 [Rhizopus microsporus ATCC 52813]PHZ15887.1 hypothetical protein RHIMIDRAFT_264429 [Rhizopus microsporus ATCC 52813]